MWNSSIRIGPAGWSYADWSGFLYPKKRPRGFHEVEFLAHWFDTIEINTSFYAPLNPDYCRQWIGYVSTNPHFLFTAKLWQRFSHEPSASREDECAVRAGFDVLREAGRLGAILLQFPFSFHRDLDSTAYLCALIDRLKDYPLVVEVRHATWNDASFYRMLDERGVGFCNIDQPMIGRSVAPSARVTARIGYVRLHGRRYDTWFGGGPDAPSHERYNYLYSEQELQPWAKRAHHIGEKSEKTFVITNNHYQAKGVVNALQLIHLLSGKKIQVPDQLREHYPQLNKIADAPPNSPTLFRI